MGAFRRTKRGGNNGSSFFPVAAGLYEICQVDAFAWLAQARACSVHAVVTDPPYGLVEYTARELEKRQNGHGGVWRIPPAYDGCKRQPLPRFTVLTEAQRAELHVFFQRLAAALYPVLVPGAHVFIATNPLVSHFVYEPFITAGFEKRGEIIRLVYTLRGGDRPKNAHDEFPDVSVMPKSCWEPWGLFRKPCEGRVQDNLRRWKTGGLRRISADEPFKDLIYSSPARGVERRLAPHPKVDPLVKTKTVPSLAAVRENSALPRRCPWPCSPEHCWSGPAAPSPGLRGGGAGPTMPPRLPADFPPAHRARYTVAGAR